jgi:hypothetical protein
VIEAAQIATVDGEPMLVEALFGEPSGPWLAIGLGSRLPSEAIERMREGIRASFEAAMQAAREMGLDPPEDQLREQMEQTPFFDDERPIRLGVAGGPFPFCLT